MGEEPVVGGEPVEGEEPVLAEEPVALAVAPACCSCGNELHSTHWAFLVMVGEADLVSVVALEGVQMVQTALEVVVAEGAATH
jgi:hypothetical protein